MNKDELLKKLDDTGFCVIMSCFNQKSPKTTSSSMCGQHIELWNDYVAEGHSHVTFRDFLLSKPKVIHEEQG